MFDSNLKSMFFLMITSRTNQDRKKLKKVKKCLDKCKIQTGCTTEGTGAAGSSNSGKYCVWSIWDRNKEASFFNDGANFIGRLRSINFDWMRLFRALSKPSTRFFRFPLSRPALNKISPGTPFLLPKFYCSQTKEPILNVVSPKVSKSCQEFLILLIFLQGQRTQKSSKQIFIKSPSRLFS